MKEAFSIAFVFRFIISIVSATSRIFIIISRRVHEDTTVFAIGVSRGTDQGSIFELASTVEGVQTAYYTPDWNEIGKILSDVTLATCTRMNSHFFTGYMQKRKKEKRNTIKE
jgi:hypothetical protein